MSSSRNCDNDLLWRVRICLKKCWDFSTERSEFFRYVLLENDKTRVLNH